MRNRMSRSNLILYAFGLIPAVWMALLVAPSLSGGLPEMLANLSTAFSKPFHIVLCEDSLKTVLIFIFAYAMGIGIYLATASNYRKREEHGSAKWGSSRAVCKKYKASFFMSNKILTQNVSIGYDSRRHRRNLNTIVVGGSGSGKTRFYAKPNVMQANTSFVILDPNGKLVLL